MGRLPGFTQEQMNNALSMAEFHAPLTPVMRSVKYPSMNKDGVPFGALVGAEATLETLAGSTAYGYLLETPKYQKYLESLGKAYEIMNLYFKPYTCCRWAHQPIQACIDLMKVNSFIHKDVEQVCVHTFDSAVQWTKQLRQGPSALQKQFPACITPASSTMDHRSVTSSDPVPSG